MEVINFDEIVFNKEPKQPKQRNPSMPTWDREGFRELIIGPSGCGKTSLLCNMLLRGLVFDDIHLFCLKPDEPYYEWLGNYFTEIEEKLNKRLEKKKLPPQKVFHIYNDLAEFPDVISLDPKLKHIIIFDDILGEKDMSKIIEYFIAGRKQGCACILLSQSFYQVPKVIRNQCNYFDLFGFPSQREISSIRSNICPEIDMALFKQMMKHCKNVDHGFLHVDRKTKNKKERFKCRFDQYFNYDSDSE